VSTSSENSGSRSRSRSIAIVGVGAIGGAVAGDLSDLGHELILCSRSPFAKLVVEHPTGISTVDAAGASRPSDLAAEVNSNADWVLLCTKAHDSAAARPWLDRVCGPHTRVAVLQNGVDHRERIEPLLPSVLSDASALLPVVVQLPSEKIEPGRIRQSRDGVLIVSDDDLGRDFASLFDGGRTHVDVREDFFTQTWMKLISNATIGGICALALQPNRAVAEPGVRDLTLALMREVALVGRAEGADLPDDAPEKVLERILRAAPDHWSSISVDRREGRPMECEVRNAVVGRLGRRHGIKTPLNDMLVALLRAAESSG